MRRQFSTVTLLLLLAACVGLVTQSCSDGDGNEDILVLPEPLVVSYTTEIEQIVAGGGQAPPAPFVSFEKGLGSGETVRVDVKAVGVTDLWAVAFTIEFDPALMEYVTGSAINGRFLGADSTVEVIVEPEIGRPDHLVVSASKLRQDPADVGVSGTGSVLTLDFTVYAKGVSTLSVAGPPNNTAAVDSQDNVMFGISSFYGATVQAQ